MAEQKSTQNLPQPLRAAASVLRVVPGAGMVGRAAEDALDKIGAVSPRGRRIAVYTGAGVLGVAGVVEWPVAITGAAVAWLTQPRREETQEKEQAKEKEQTEEQAEAVGSTARAGAASGTPPTPQAPASTSGRSSAADTAVPPTPSDKLPTASSSGSGGSSGPSGSTTARRARTNG
ncbi:hypothetical protein [Streptomyces sp. AC555_RSS877]|uniref:hypothetical protein n=1 Tax=Streptomyces sp. AC555_RSS877 TaxID=2823688 RepID=UPI001C256D74|nr:hypothetical protein [Streptomyces sp. AC555_RSS877]